MSLEKAIQSGKEKRKPYRGGKAIDKWCRNGNQDSIPLNSRKRRDFRQGGS